jgi:hypothetical protein
MFEMFEKLRENFQTYRTKRSLLRDLQEENFSLSQNNGTIAISYVNKDGPAVIGSYDVATGRFTPEPNHEVATPLYVVNKREEAVEIARKNNVIVVLQ